MLNEMYTNNIKVKLEAELIGGNFMLRICTRNAQAEASRFITEQQAELPQVLYYWIKQSIYDVATYCSKEIEK